MLAILEFELCRGVAPNIPVRAAVDADLVVMHPVILPSEAVRAGPRHHHPAVGEQTVVLGFDHLHQRARAIDDQDEGVRAAFSRTVIRDDLDEVLACVGYVHLIVQGGAAIDHSSVVTEQVVRDSAGIIRADPFHEESPVVGDDSAPMGQFHHRSGQVDIEHPLCRSAIAGNVPCSDPDHMLPEVEVEQFDGSDFASWLPFAAIDADLVSVKARSDVAARPAHIDVNAVRRAFPGQEDRQQGRRGIDNKGYVDDMIVACQIGDPYRHGMGSVGEAAEEMPVEVGRGNVCPSVQRYLCCRYLCDGVIADPGDPDARCIDQLIARRPCYVRPWFASVREEMNDPGSTMAIEIIGPQLYGVGAVGKTGQR